MEARTAGRTGNAITRRQALARLGLLAAGAVAGCTPLRIALHAYPQRYDGDADLVGCTLGAFADTVVPGADVERIVGVLTDPFYGLEPYRGYLAADLDRRAREAHGADFADLDRSGRAGVVASGTESSDGTTRKLYCGAVFLSQVAAFGGAGDGDGACDLIGWEGPYVPRPLSKLTYPEPERFLPPALTSDGNFA